VRSYLPAVVDASRVTESPVAGTPAGTVVVRAADLRVRGKTVTAGEILKGTRGLWDKGMRCAGHAGLRMMVGYGHAWLGAATRGGVRPTW